jgi:3-hydroxymyristoyl/3-hydroxydecanoyl-(acyl carrier protein) dehydratase
MRDEVARSLLRREATAGGCRAVFSFAPDLEVFAGHFPGQPIVPGVYLIEAVRLAAERTLGRPVRIRAIGDAKFSAPVRPGEEVTVELTLSGPKARATLAGGTRIRLTLEAQG